MMKPKYCDKDTSMTRDEWIAEAMRRFGPDHMRWRFVCPVCGHVASIQDWKNAGAPVEAAAFSCVGRWLGAKGFKEKGKGPCDYAGGGLFRLNPVKVDQDGVEHQVFAFARLREGITSMPPTTTPAWRQRLDALIRDVLAGLPPDASDKEKRRALREHAPGRYDSATTRRHWQAAVRDWLGPAFVRKAPKLPAVKRLPGMDDILYGLLAYYREHPTDDAQRFHIADRCDELGQDGRAAYCRTVQVDTEAVAKRVWPGCGVVWIGGAAEQTRWLCRSGRKLALVRDFEDMVCGRTLLVDPAVVEAAAVERCAVVLRFFMGEDTTDA